jgi:hypothetical protein
MNKTFIKTISVCLILLGFVVPLNAQETETSQKFIRRRVLPIPQKPSQQGVVLQKNYKGHSYRFMPNQKTWHEARKDAESLGGYLVVITNKEEDDFVLQLIRDANNGETPHVWIGLTDEAKEGELRWVNGDKTVYWRNSPNKFNPSDVGDEDFVHFYAAPVGAQEVNWNDNTGNCEFAYVIESDQERPEIVPAQPIKEAEVQESEFRYENHTYKFVPKKESWMRARKSAEKEGGYLVVINNENEEKYLEQKIKEFLGLRQEPVWIGLNDIDEEGKWSWVNSDKITYTKWLSGEPNNNGGYPESCVVIEKRNDYGWNDNPMDAEHFYITEKD